MRKLACVALVGLVLAVVSCGPKKVPAPVVTPPTVLDFIRPVVPPSLAGGPAAAGFDRGWQFLRAGNLKNAEGELALVLRATPGFYPAETGLGYVEFARHDPKAALARFDRALERQADEVSALVGRGEALVALGREADAVESFDRALVADSSLSDLRRRVDVLKFRSAERDLTNARQAAASGKSDEAIAAYLTAIEHSPDSAFLYREIAAIERRSGGEDRALGHLRQAVALDPGDAASFTAIGELLEMMGATDGAVQAYTSALAIEPNSAVQARLEQVRVRLAIASLPEQYRAIDGLTQVTRADLAALVGVRLAPVLQTPQSATGVVVTDARNNWAEMWIMTVVRAGIIDPFPNHAFQPRTVIRRADLADAVSRLLAKITPPAQLKAWQSARVRLSDVPASHLSYPAVSVSVASGVLAATPDGAFQPNRVIGGQEAIAAVDRLQEMARLPGQGGQRR